MTTAPPRRTTGSLWLIFAIAFLNLVGATIIIPVLPFIVRQYVHDPAAIGLWVGLLPSAFSACAFLSAPALGKLSDRVGRKPVLFVSLLGSAIGFVVLGPEAIAYVGTGHANGKVVVRVSAEGEGA